MKYVVLSLFSVASLVFFFWGYQNAMFSVPAKDPTFYEQRAVEHFNQAMGTAIVGAALFIALLIRDRRAAGKEGLDRHLSIWGPFVLTTLLTLAVDAMGWRLSTWFWPLSILGLLSLVSGIWAIWRTRGAAVANSAGPRRPCHRPTLVYPVRIDKLRAGVRKITVSSNQDVRRILDYVHDRHFQLSDIHFDRADARLSIPLTVETGTIQDLRRYLFFSRWKCTVVKAELVIRNVTDFALKDNAQVGEGVIDTIEIGTGVGVIACALPVEVRASVSRADIELMLTDELVGTVSHFSFGSPQSGDLQQLQ